ncbi:MAG: tRNA (N(6)-L-threonylcarbamoyladenosine(37)-C(2))-methylthiotransferase MtaB [Holosporaceae bacterium]|jgi:threonylcarbamoyladenosine tRNA methylthiotransferase MtaB|nr:tRNA (N(6)-L-threonylcarbamoyladenosine(37)-C(2))-methylthiotransferase MtaB [Holosporaceae bacterium]
MNYLHFHGILIFTEDMNSINVVNFGCRLNACESDLIKGFVYELGIVDFTVINTCAVTTEAERKLRQTIRKLYGKNPDIKIILTGCASELNPDYYIKMDGVVGIISNKTKLSKSEYLKYAIQRKISSVPLRPKVRGFLQIQNGCDQKCTYCIVRLTRGNNVSFHEDEILQQAKLLLTKGYKEIILTGVNITSYGRDLDAHKKLPFIVRYLLKNLPELTRLGLSSLDPADIDDDLLKIIVSEEKLLPHIHESVQSGDDLILKRMMRRHTRTQVIELNEKILCARPDVIFGADIIVGFPTETEEMFSNTKTLLREAKLSLLHIFPFSPRPKTAASLMPRVEKKIIAKRISELKQLADDILTQKLTEQIGANVIILAEDHFNAKTNSFLPAKSLDTLVTGREYLFHCESIEKNVIIGYPVKEI